jgi:hypothetical protein
MATFGYRTDPLDPQRESHLGRTDTAAVQAQDIAYVLGSLQTRIYDPAGNVRKADDQTTYGPATSSPEAGERERNVAWVSTRVELCTAADGCDATPMEPNFFQRIRGN